MIAIWKRDKRRCYKYRKNDEFARTYFNDIRDMVLKHDTAEMSTNYFSVMWKMYPYDNVFISRCTRNDITMN